jgi:hypothetical protein
MASPIKGRTGGVKIASLLGKLRGHVSEAKNRAGADQAQRQSAAEGPNSIILNADDVHGEYDTARALYTTLGGEKRVITRDDLAAFRKNIRIIGKKYKGGIRARQVLDMSLAIDRERAREQIRMAVPASSNNGIVRFVTNAGPDSDVARHHVTINFLSYSAAVSSGRGDAKQMAGWLRKEPLKIECDCGRFRYWYRYIATIGSFNAGRNETGYPKIRNPGLHGVACKHILRVVAEIESSGTVWQFLTRMIERARQADGMNTKTATTQEDADEMAQKQNKRARDIKTTDDRKKASDAAKAKKALLAKVVEAAKPKRETAASKSRSVERTKAEFEKLVKPVAKPAPKPVLKPAPTPKPESIQKPVVKPAPKPVTPKPAPIQKPIQKPVAKPVVKPIPPKPTPKPAPSKVDKAKKAISELSAEELANAMSAEQLAALLNLFKKG